MKPVLAAALAALLSLFVTDTPAVESPPSVAALFSRVPELPATAEEAATWVDKSGRLVHPGVLALRADIEAHQRAIGLIQQAAAERHQAQSAVVVENLGKGMADVGIDMARMQRDPAYAQQVQERMRKMSPQELMAMSQKMNQPLNQDKRHQNQAQAMVEDSATNRAAAEAGEAYASAQMKRFDAQNVLWREADEAVARVMKKPLAVPGPKPTPEWENIGCDAGCRAQWDAYASKLLPLMVARDTEALRIRRAALQRQRAAVADGIKAADKHLVATQYGAASTSQVNQGNIVRYDGAAIAEISYLLDRITDSVKSAAVVVHCGKQIVLAPGAVCR
ncbi:MAG: hypothetical protein IV105_11520 [Rhizobacter sp.]|nr:hypothetical protein [Rhizobacter sp.]